MKRNEALLRRQRKIRSKIARLDVARLTITRSLQHICAQLIEPNGNVVASASSLEKLVREQRASIEGGKVGVAKMVGKLVAERIKSLAYKGKIAFDRSGLKYHGRVAALADAAREGGLEF